MTLRGSAPCTLLPAPSKYMAFIQTLLLLFVVFAAYKTWKRLNSGDITGGQFLFWSAVWLAVGLATIFPQWTVVIANRFGVGRGADFVLYLAVAFLLYRSFKTSVKMRSLDRHITSVVRRNALEDSSHENSPDQL